MKRVVAERPIDVKVGNFRILGDVDVAPGIGKLRKLFSGRREDLLAKTYEPLNLWVREDSFGSSELVKVTTDGQVVPVVPEVFQIFSARLHRLSPLRRDIYVVEGQLDSMSQDYDSE